MEERPKHHAFEVGDPVVILTERAFLGLVTGIEDIPYVGAIRFTPQSFRGEKGWVLSMVFPVSGDGTPALDGDPTAYDVVFRLEGIPRMVVIYQEDEAGVPLRKQRPVDRGRGLLMDVKPEDLAPEPSLVGTIEGLTREMYEAGEFDLDPSDVLFHAAELLSARQASLQPEASLARWRGISPQLPAEWVQEQLASGRERWERFQKQGWSSVHGYVAAWIAREDAGRLDWSPVLAAIEQAEQGDWSSFELLQGDVNARGSEALLDTGRRDPGVPTTACFDCDAILPVTETWVNKKGLALCESCFRKREVKGRARRWRKPFPSEEAETPREAAGGGAGFSLTTPPGRR